MFVRPVLSMDEATWVECHVLGLSFFGGGVRRIVPDNLKTGVIRPDLYDPLINKAFGEFAAHYGCLVDPARRLKPRDKARVERPVPYVRDSFFAGREDEFKSVTHMQHDALRWSGEVANRRRHRGIERVTPRDLFEAEERGELVAIAGGRLRALPLVIAEGAAGHPREGGKGPLLGPLAPHRAAGRRALRPAHGRDLRGRERCRHPRADRARPPDQLRPTTRRRRSPFSCARPPGADGRAGELGESVSAVVTEIMAVNALYRLRQAQGVVGLADVTEPSAWRRPARRRFWSATPPTRR